MPGVYLPVLVVKQLKKWYFMKFWIQGREKLKNVSVASDIVTAYSRQINVVPHDAVNELKRKVILLTDKF